MSTRLSAFDGGVARRTWSAAIMTAMFWRGASTSIAQPSSFTQRSSRARPDAVSSAHAHSLHGKAFLHARDPAGPAHPVRVRVFRRPRPVRGIRRCRQRCRGGQADRRVTGRSQGRDPAESRADHGRQVDGRGGVVVRIDGPRMPGAIAGDGSRTRTHPTVWRPSRGRPSA